MIIYNTNTRLIVAKIPRGQPYDYLEGNNAHLILDDYPADWFNHRVDKERLVKLSDLEMLEVNTHNKILTECERIEVDLLNALIPSHDEIQKAENTIEILTLLSEVL